jgi:hypothetical protein
MTRFHPHSTGLSPGRLVARVFRTSGSQPPYLRSNERGLATDPTLVTFGTCYDFCLQDYPERCYPLPVPLVPGELVASWWPRGGLKRVEHSHGPPPQISPSRLVLLDGPSAGCETGPCEPRSADILYWKRLVSGEADITSRSTVPSRWSSLISPSTRNEPSGTRVSHQYIAAMVRSSSYNHHVLVARGTIYNLLQGHHKDVTSYECP